jgi:hypothetical protein
MISYRNRLRAQKSCAQILCIKTYYLLIARRERKKSEKNDILKLTSFKKFMDLKNLSFLKHLKNRIFKLNLSII